jgi:hypothetical protein
VNQHTLGIIIAFSTESDVVAEGELVERSLGFSSFNDRHHVMPDGLEILKLVFIYSEIRLNGDTLL